MFEYLPPGSTGVSALMLVLLLFRATRSDLATRKIPNSITYPSAVAALGLNLLVTISRHFGWTDVQRALGGIGFSESLTGGAVVLSGMFLLFLLGCGAGDVKLMTVVGCLLGMKTAAEIWFCSLLIAAVYVVAITVTNPFRRINRSDPENGAEVADANLLRKRIPLAPFFSAGAFSVLLFPLLNDGQRLWSRFYSIL